MVIFVSYKGRLNSERDMWKRVDREELDEFHSSQVYKPKASKQAGVVKLYEELEDREKQERLARWRNIRLTLVLVTVVIALAIVIGITVYGGD